MRKIILLPGMFCFICLAGAVQAETILVSAAASLTNAFRDIGSAFTRQYPAVKVHFNFGSSGALQRQIEQGAPVDVFAAAASKEMNLLQKEGLTNPATRKIFAENRLVLITPMKSSIHRWRDLLLPVITKVAISDPASVPSGRYAEQTLKKHGIWNAVRQKMVLGEDVRQTLAYVAQGNAKAGIVFLTDAYIDAGRVKVACTAIPGKDHIPIVYPIAVLKHAPHPLYGEKFIQFVDGPAGRVILKRYGFALPARKTAAHKKL